MESILPVALLVLAFLLLVLFNISSKQAEELKETRFLLAKTTKVLAHYMEVQNKIQEAQSDINNFILKGRKDG